MPTYPPPPDRTEPPLLDISQAPLVRYWAHRLMCNEKQLRQAVATVGPR